MSGLIGLSQKRNGVIDQFTSLGIDDNATSNAVTIDASENVTITDGAHDFDVASHDTSNGLKLGGTLVTATAAELNYLDTTSGTPGSTTFLRGDKTWQTAGSTSASDLDSGTLATARMASGTIIQTVTGINTGKQTVSAGSYTQAFQSPSITPSSASNKVIVSFTTLLGTTGASGNKQLKVYRNGVTDLVQSGNVVHGYMSGDRVTYAVDCIGAWTYTDSPAATSATYYSIMVADDGADQFIVGGRAADTDADTGVFWLLQELKG